MEGQDGRWLFDAGADFPTLWHNARLLGASLSGLRGVFLSHLHHDHVGGLRGLAERLPALPLYAPQALSAPEGWPVVCVREARRLGPGVWSTGPMDGPIPEQAMVLEAGGGAVITGCAHPGALRVVERARRLVPSGVEVLLGGLHLVGLGPAEARAVARRLRELGVRRVAPAHCTGQVALAELRRAFGEGFVEAGVGLVLEL